MMMHSVQAHPNPCYNCNGRDLVLHYEAGDIICTSCGVVNCSRVIDESDEVRCYQDDENNSKKSSRTSGMMQLFDSMQTEFVTSSSTLKATLEKAQRQSLDVKEAKVMKHISRIGDLCSKMDLNYAIQTTTLEVFSKAVQEEAVSLNTANLEAVLGACVYIACRKVGYPRTFDEISYKTDIPTLAISKQHSIIASKLQLEIGRVKAESLVNRYGSPLRLGNHEIIHYAEVICQQTAAHALLEGVKPQGIASAAILMSCLIFNTAVDLGKLAGASFISVAYLKNTYQQMAALRLAIVPQELWKSKKAAIDTIPRAITNQAMLDNFCGPRAKCNVNTAKEQPPNCSDGVSSSGSNSGIQRMTAAKRKRSSNDIAAQMNKQDSHAIKRRSGDEQHL